MSYRPLNSASFVEGDIVQQIGGLLTGVDIGKVHQGVRLHSAGVVTAYSTITAALAAAVPADTVIVGPGTYNESITIPDGVRVVGTAPAQEVIIAGADATSTRVTFGGTCTLREVTVQAPSAGANPAIECNLAAGKMGVVFAVAVQGAGGSGPSIHKAGAGILAMLGGYYHNGGAFAGPLMQFDAGRSIVQQFIANAGSSTTLCEVNGGTVEARDWLVQSSALYSCTDYIELAGAGAEFVLKGLQADRANPACTNSAVKITADGIELRASNADFYGATLDFDVGLGLLGTNSHLDLTGCHLRYERLSFPAAFATTADIHAMFLDDADQNDPTIRCIAEFSVGSPEVPHDSAFGEGESTVNGMEVWSFDGVATWVNNTTFAKSASGSLFNLFQGVGGGNIGYVGNLTRPFTSIKVKVTTGMVLGAGSVVTEYWNGVAWVGFNTMSSNASAPYESYANDYLQRVQGEQVRFDDAMLDDWAQTAVNGVTAYWIRFRVVNAITAVPALERIKIGTNRTEIDPDGTVEHFGTAEPELIIWEGTGRNLSTPAGGAGQAPTTATINISANVSYQQERSRYADGSDNRRAGTMIKIPAGLDTSRALRMTLAFTTDGTDTNPVRWDLYVAQVRDGDTLGALTEQLITNATLPNAANAANEVHIIEFSIRGTELVEGDFIAFMLYRMGATDANPDDATALTMKLSGYYYLT